jgi:hypothetical protein
MIEILWGTFMYNVVGYKNKPAVVISKNDNVATVMYFIEEDNIVQAKTETIYDKNLLSDYKCPYADETDPTRIYCSEGKCRYQLKSPAQLSFICSGCLAESYIFEDNNIER